MDKKFQIGKIYHMELWNFFPYKPPADLINCVGAQKLQIHVGQPAHSQLQILRAEQVQNHAEWRCRRQAGAQRHRPLARLPFAQAKLAHPCRVVGAIFPAEREWGAAWRQFHVGATQRGVGQLRSAVLFQEGLEGLGVRDGLFKYRDSWEFF